MEGSREGRREEMNRLKCHLCNVSSALGITASSLPWDGVRKKVFFGILLVTVIAFVKYEGKVLFAFLSWG